MERGLQRRAVDSHERRVPRLLSKSGRFARAGQFAAIDELLVGDQCVLKMTGAPSSPGQAVEFLLSSKVEDPAEALRKRAHIGGLINRCVPVKVGGHVRPEFKCLLSGADGAREAILMVIAENK